MEEIKYIRGTKPSTNTLKLRKLVQDKDFCFNCKNEFNKCNLEVEHKIPVCLGGKDNLENLSILCKKCHKIKTKKDSLLINFFKKAGALEKVALNWYQTKLSIKELQELYLLLSDICSRCDTCDTISHQIPLCVCCIKPLSQVSQVSQFWRYFQ